MRKGYEAPQAELLLLSCEDVMTASSGISIETGAGESGGSVDFGDWLNNLNNGGQGSSGSNADINDIPLS